MTLLEQNIRSAKPRDELAWLESSFLAPGVCVMTDARRFHERTKAEAVAFLAKRRKPFPAPDHILNPRPRQRREANHG